MSSLAGYGGRLALRNCTGEDEIRSVEGAGCEQGRPRRNHPTQYFPKPRGAPRQLAPTRSPPAVAGGPRSGFLLHPQVLHEAEGVRSVWGLETLQPTMDEEAPHHGVQDRHWEVPAEDPHELPMDLVLNCRIGCSISPFDELGQLGVVVPD